MSEHNCDSWDSCPNPAHRPADARREVEDLWWLRDSLESLLGEQPDGHMIRVGVLRNLIKTTAPETETTHPRTPKPDAP